MGIIILIGPSGSGKDTIGDLLAAKGIPQLISFTTRKKRKGEVDKKDYYFLDIFDYLHSDIVEETTYSGNSYGLLREEVDKKLSENKTVYFISNVDGAKQLIKMYPNKTSVFWLKIDLNTMKKRMIKRGDSIKEIDKRLSLAKKTNETTIPKLKNIVELDATKTPQELVSKILNKKDVIK